MSLTFVTDDKPEELSLELLEVMSKSEPFVTPKHMYVVRSASYLDINSDDSNICYVLRIIDQGLDGLRNGKFG